MFQKRRSMLGRRHLIAQQQDQGKSAQVQSQPVAANRDGGVISSQRASTSWRGQRSGKKKTPNRLDKASKEFKKCLFSKSPGQGRKHHVSNENLFNETGISSLTATPSSSITPASAHSRTAEEGNPHYGSLTVMENFTVKPYKPSSRPISMKQTTACSYDFDNLRPPDSPGPSHLEKLLLEEKLHQNSSILNLDTLKPPVSPGPSRLDKLIIEQKLELPLDPDLKKLQTLSLGDPNVCLQFSPPLSSTCIGSPDSGKKNAVVVEEIKSRLGSGRKLSTITEDCDMSVIEFELNERTIRELDDSMQEIDMNNTISNLSDAVNESTMNITIKPNNVTHKENVMESNHTEDWDQRWKTFSECLDNMERTVMNRAVDYANTLENLKKQFEKECQEDISRIRNMKKSLESLKRTGNDLNITQNKENEPSFKVPTCRKKQMDEESKWLSSVKAQNSSLLKTPKTNRKMNQSAVWTPHSLTNVLHDQLNTLYD